MILHSVTSSKFTDANTKYKHPPSLASCGHRPRNAVLEFSSFKTPRNLTLNARMNHERQTLTLSEHQNRDACVHQDVLGFATKQELADAFSPMG